MTLKGETVDWAVSLKANQNIFRFVLSLPENPKDATVDVQSSPAWRDLYPFDSHYLALGDGRMHYIDQQPESPSGETVLMVHGNPTWSFYYRRLIETLGRQHRVVAVDHLGCGLSDKPDSFDYCLESHIENLCHLIDHLKLENVTLMAHDWGGAIGMGALLERKECFRKIVLFNTAAFPPPYLPFRIGVCRWPLIGKLLVQGFNAFAGPATWMATERDGGLPKVVAEGMLHPYDSWKNRIAIYRFVQDIPMRPSHRTWSVLARLESRLSEVRDWPILLIWGMKDWCFRPSCLRRFQQHWPAANVVEAADAGHYVVEDAAELVEQQVSEFLQ